MKKLNSALAQNGILKSIALVMLVLVATFGVALSMESFTNCSEIGGRSTHGEFAASDIGGSRGQETRFPSFKNQPQAATSTFEIGGRSTSSELAVYDIGGSKGVNGEFSSTPITSDIGGRSQEPSYEYSVCAIGGKNTPSTGQYSVCFDQLNSELNFRMIETKGCVLRNC
jgi:hypothetical protein